jgi:hypothetical protein
VILIENSFPDADAFVILGTTIESNNDIVFFFFNSIPFYFLKNTTTTSALVQIYFPYFKSYFVF